MHEISQALLAWYDAHARVLPWRGIHDPYRTWVSEAMLQQTRVETVLSYYNRFLARFPDLPSLASAEESEVLKQWEGLGYYSRARNLRIGAKQVMEEFGGVLPPDPLRLQTIHGIGAYTAGAIASIAYNRPVPAVDGNVIRVFSRLFGIRQNAALPEVRKSLESLDASLIPADRPGDYNQAVMDLGATVCIPGTPDCARCPLSAFCDAYRRGDAADLPVLPRSKPPKIVPWFVPVICSGENVLLRQRTEKLLQGLWCFPLLSPAEDGSDLVHRKLNLNCVPAGETVFARHVFTHQVWEMAILLMRAENDPPTPKEYCWIPRSALSSLAFPTAMNAALMRLR